MGDRQLGFADHRRPFATRLPAPKSREKIHKEPIVTTSSTTPSALAAPQFAYKLTVDSIRIAHMMTRPPPISAGVTKKPRQRTKIRTTPAAKPGKESGKNT